MNKKMRTKLIVLTLALTAGVLGGYANTLSQVEINASESGYAVVLKTESAARMKKVVTSPDKMYIELKDVQAAADLNTVYNNVANMENVTIQPVSDKDLKITLQGGGISSSKVYFENAKTLPLASEPSESLEIGAPVNSFKPVYSQKYVEEVDQTANPAINAALTKMNVDRQAVVNTKSFIKKILNPLKDKNILFALGLLLIAGALIFKPKKQPSHKIGLSHSLSNDRTEREIAIAKSLLPPVNANSLRQSSLSTANYGMNAYRKSLKNPYVATDSPSFHKSGVSGIPRKPQVKKTPLTYASQQKAPVQTNKMQTISTPIQAQAPSSLAQNANVNIDSVKFLESITKIYEKNGREDLAKGLKDNLKKARTVSHAI